MLAPWCALFLATAWRNAPRPCNRGAEFSAPPDASGLTLSRLQHWSKKTDKGIGMTWVTAPQNDVCHHADF
jgi:hypothetical protein